MYSLYPRQVPVHSSEVSQRTIWELMWLSFATLILLFFIYPETSTSNVLYQRACRLHKATGNSWIMSTSEIGLMTMSARDLAVDILVHPFTLNFQEPIVFALNVYISLIYALLYIWCESFPVVFTSGESSCLAYASSACSSARSLSCHPSSPTCITCKSPSITLTAS